MRVDKKKNVQKLLQDVIVNPLATQRERAKANNMSVWTVNANLKEVEQIWNKSDYIANFVKTDIEVQDKIQKELLRRLEESPKQIRDPDLKWYAEFALKRSQLLQGKATEKVDHSITSITIE